MCCAQHDRDIVFCSITLPCLTGTVYISIYNINKYIKCGCPQPSVKFLKITWPKVTAKLITFFLTSVCKDAAIKRMSRVLQRMLIAFTVCVLPAIGGLVAMLLISHRINPLRPKRYSPELKLFQVSISRRQFQSLSVNFK